MIGVNIRDNKDIFMQTFNDGNDIAVHTWTHRYMTSLSDEEIVAEFGYTMQIISDFTGGRVARYWRPPYGDSDNRVRAIAKHIFNLIQVDWNHDTDDWELGTKQITPEKIASELKSFIALPKSPGLIILEHELYPGTVQAFIDAYPLMKSAGWDTRSIPQLYNTGFYQNAQDNTSPVTPQDIISGNPTANGTTPTTSASVSVSGSASSGNPSATQSGSPTMSGAALAASSAPAPSGSTSPKTNAGIASVAEVSKKALGAVFVLVVPLLLA
ncbi:hypothetical protein FRB99_002134 [Tulasnella sp. 403]|nr:hypothetical protein FRB99_002134 [Tulasnella sp. 403]